MWVSIHCSKVANMHEGHLLRMCVFICRPVSALLGNIILIHNFFCICADSKHAVLVFCLENASDLFNTQAGKVNRRQTLAVSGHRCGDPCVHTVILNLDCIQITYNDSKQGWCFGPSLISKFWSGKNKGSYKVRSLHRWFSYWARLRPRFWRHST